MERLAILIGLRHCLKGASVFCCALVFLAFPGCKDPYQERSEPMYEALVQLRGDVRTNAQIQVFAAHLTAADRAREQWACHVRHFATRRKSARTLDDVLQMYGKVGTLRMMEGAKTVGCRPTDRDTLDRAEQALAFVRLDLDEGR